MLLFEDLVVLKLSASTFSSCHARFKVFSFPIFGNTVTIAV